MTHRLVFAALALAAVLIPTQVRAQDAGSADPSSTEADIPMLAPTEVIASPLNEVTEIASPVAGTAARVFDISAPALALSGPRLERRRRGTLGEMLAREPGISQTAFGPAASRPVIRGLSGERVRVLDGGFGVADAAALSDDHATVAEPYAARRIDVLRGPAVLRFGPQAIGGVANVEDGRIPKKWIRRRLTGVIDVRGGTADGEVGGFARVEGQQGPWNWHVSGFGRKTDDVEVPGFARSSGLRAAEPVDDPDEEAFGVVPNSNTWTRGASVGLSHVTRSGFIGVSVNWFRTEYGIPGAEDHHHDDDDDHDDKIIIGPRPAVQGVDDEGVDIDLERIRFDLRGRTCAVPGCWSHVDYGLAFTTYEHTEFEEGGVGTRFFSDTFEGRVEATHKRMGVWRGTVGIQGSYNDFAAIGDEAFVPASQTTALGVFLFEEARLNACQTAEFGLRYDFRSIDSREDLSFHAFSASAGYKQKLTRCTMVRGSISYTQRPPTAAELLSDGPHLAVQRFEIGDSSLSNETSWGIDAGIRHERDRLAVGFNAYYTRYPTFLELAPNGAVMDDLPVSIYREQEAEIYGVEFESVLRLIEVCGCEGGLDVELVADWLRGNNLTQDAPLPRMPPWRVGAGLVYAVGPWNADVRATRVGEQTRLAANETATDGYTMLDAGIGYTFRGRAPLTVYARGTNLLDEEARVHSSFLKDQVPLRGRSFLFGVRLEF